MLQLEVSCVDIVLLHGFVWEICAESGTLSRIIIGIARLPEAYTFVQCKFDLNRID